MNDKFENQKEKLLAIKQEISLLYQQINYLIRNEKSLELLDLDVLMNRAHTLYDMLCSINVGEMGDEEDFPIDAEAFSGLFGGMMDGEETSESEHQNDIEEEPVPIVEEVVSEPVLFKEPEQVEVPEPEENDAVIVEEDPLVEQKEERLFEEEEEEVPMVEEEAPTVISEDDIVEQTVENKNNKTELVNPEDVVEKEPTLGDEFGFFFRFEDVPVKEEEIKEEPLVQGEENDKVVHVLEEIPEEEIPERDRIHGEDLVQDNPLEMPKMEEIPVSMELENERQTSETVGDFFEQDDAEFELSTTETLGEKMMGEDFSLAAKLQQNPVHDLKSAIGINDKFLFVNELFGGSMEKYNKSIENLNDLKTLNGAMIYMNELKVELQWNSSNEAYQRLKDLVSRKFE